MLQITDPKVDSMFSVLEMFQDATLVQKMKDVKSVRMKNVTDGYIIPLMNCISIAW